MKEEMKTKIVQYTAAISTCLTIIGYGCSVSWTSPALPYLTSKESEFPVSESEGSWIASLVNIGMISGYILNAILIDKMGRRRTLLLLSIPQLTASILIIFARDWQVLCISRIINGIGYGGGLCAATAYLADIGNQNTRGIFLVMIKLSLNLGIFSVMLLGAYLPYRSMNLVLLFLPIIFILSFLFMPDSSYFTERERRTLPISMKKQEEMKKSKEVEMKMKSHQEEEMNLLNKTVRVEMKLKDSNEKSKETSLKKQTFGRRLKNIFLVKSDRRALIIVSLMFATEVLSGHAAVMAYAQEIFQYSESSLPAEYASLVLSSVKIIASLLSTQIVERINRKTLFLSAGMLASIAQGIVGIFFLLKLNFKVNMSSVSWIPLFGITMYEVVGNAGIGSLAFVYIGELFSSEVKGVAITLTNVTYEIIAFLVKLQFRVLVDNVGIAGTFFIFSTCCTVGTGIVFYLVPETRGKSLEEIQKALMLGKRMKIEESRGKNHYKSSENGI